MREASTKCVDEYIASIWGRLKTALWEAQAQSMAEALQQKWYYDRKIGAVNLKSGNLVLVKVDAFKGKRRSRIGGKRIHGRWCIRSCQTSPLMKWWTNTEGHASSTKPTSSHCIRGWHSLVYRCLSCMGQVYQPHAMQAHLHRRWNWNDATREYW